MTIALRADQYWCVCEGLLLGVATTTGRGVEE